MKTAKFVSIVLTVILIFSSLSVMASAASATTRTISTFGHNVCLTDNDYKALKSGTISAVKKDGNWYYVFTLKNNSTVVHTLYVLNTAFKTVGNESHSSVNSSLANGFTTATVTKTHYYHKDLVSKIYEPSYDDYGYGVRIHDIAVSTDRSGTKMTVTTRIDSAVYFYWDSRVSLTKKASTAKEFISCLSRTSYTADTLKKANPKINFTPNLVFEVKKPGDALVMLKKYECSGYGVVKENEIQKLNKYLRVAYYTGSLVKSLAAKDLSGLYSALGTANSIASTILKDGGKYVNNGEFPLTETSKKPCMKVQVKSPIDLRTGNPSDYFTSYIYLSSKPSTSGNKTTFGCQFWVDASFKRIG